MTSELPALKQTATILALVDIKDESKENISKEIVNFLMSPTGKTIEEVQKDEPEPEPEPEEGEDEELGEEVREKFVKLKNSVKAFAFTGRRRRGSEAKREERWS